MPERRPRCAVCGRTYRRETPARNAYRAGRAQGAAGRPIPPARAGDPDYVRGWEAATTSSR